MQTSEVKDIYNSLIKEKLDGDYENNRWFKDDIAKTGYMMTRDVINHYINSTNLIIKNYLELGPGPGTWTKLFVQRFPTATFDLVDISKEMLFLAKNKFALHENINFFESDFLKFNSAKKYELFFSSRVIEYLPDKKKAIEKIYSFLSEDGYGFIITKMPKYFINKLINRKTSALHSGQIYPRHFKKILKESGFRNIKIYPVTMVFPFLKSAFVNKVIYKTFARLPLNFFSSLFSESYCISFKK